MQGDTQPHNSKSPNQSTDGKEVPSRDSAQFEDYVRTELRELARPLEGLDKWENLATGVGIPGTVLSWVAFFVMWLSWDFLWWTALLWAFAVMSPFFYPMMIIITIIEKKTNSVLPTFDERFPKGTAERETSLHLLEQRLQWAAEQIGALGRLYNVVRGQPGVKSEIQASLAIKSLKDKSLRGEAPAEHAPKTVLELYSQMNEQAASNPTAGAWIAVCHLLAAERVNVIDRVSGVIGGGILKAGEPTWRVSRAEAIRCAGTAISLLGDDTEGIAFLREILTRAEGISEPGVQPTVRETEVTPGLFGGAYVFRDETIAIHTLANELTMAEIKDIVKSIPGHEWLIGHT